MPVGRRNAAIALCVGITATVASACTEASQRDAAVGRVLEAEARSYEALGLPGPLEAQTTNRARLECLWDAIRERGVDPRPDFECAARRIEETARCLRRGDLSEDCTALANASCGHSRAMNELPPTICSGLAPDAAPQ